MSVSRRFLIASMEMARQLSRANRPFLRQYSSSTSSSNQQEAEKALKYYNDAYCNEHFKEHQEIKINRAYARLVNSLGAYVTQALEEFKEAEELLEKQVRHFKHKNLTHETLSEKYYTEGLLQEFKESEVRKNLPDLTNETACRKAIDNGKQVCSSIKNGERDNLTFYYFDKNLELQSLNNKDVAKLLDPPVTEEEPATQSCRNRL